MTKLPSIVATSPEWCAQNRRPVTLAAASVTLAMELRLDMFLSQIFSINKNAKRRYALVSNKLPIDVLP